MGAHIGAGDARNRHPGLFYQVYNRKLQQWVTIAWPRKRPNLSPITRAQNATFAAAMKLVRKACGEDRIAAGIYVAGKPFLPQDALMAATMGTLYEHITINGKRFWSYRIMETQVQAMLDSIGSIPGSMLVRSDTEWVALAPGTDKEVLTFDGTTGLPDWQPASGGGGGAGNSSLIQPVQISVTFDAFASVGQVMTASLDCEVTAIGSMVQTNAGYSVYLGIAPWDNATKKMTADPTISGTFTFTSGTSNTPIQFKLPTPLQLSAGDKVLVFATRTDSTPNAKSEVYTASTTTGLVAMGLTCQPLEVAELVSTAPTKDDVWTTKATAFYFNALVGLK